MDDRNSILSGQKILLGVTGGVAAYKSAELVRLLVGEGAEVQVVMTSAASHFIGAATFQAVSGRRVRDNLWDPDAEASMGHIELARWADRIIIAPATADCLATLAAGAAPDLLSTLCLASDAPILLAPAMNQAMWRNPATQANVETLRARGIGLLGPGVGEQACGDVGPGRMVEPAAIVAALEAAVAGPVTQTLKGLTLLITAGPTREPIDPVRYITNRSSGKMGFALAKAARDRGARVVIVAGPVHLEPIPGVEQIDVETAAEMFAAVQEKLPGVDIFVGCAAVSDYRPADPATQKMKRKADALSLDLVKSQDVLAGVSGLSAGPFTVGFAAETQSLEENAAKKLKAKGLDMIAANLVGPDLAFDSDENALLVLWADGQTQLAPADKHALSGDLMDLIAERYRVAIPVDRTGSD